MALNEKILENYRRSLGYNDQQWELWRSNPHNIKVAEALIKAQKYTVMAEVVKSCNCGAGHKEGDRFIFTGAGSYVRKEPEGPVCLGALGPLIPMVNTEIINTIIIGGNPENVVWDVVHCSDVGVENGGWGEILMKVRIEKA